MEKCGGAASEPPRWLSGDGGLHVTLVAAMTADGKIGPVDRRPLRFGEPDLRRLEAHCAAADALILGAGALRAHGTTVRVREPALLDDRRRRGLLLQPLTCVVTATGQLDRGVPFFARQPVPRAIATTTAGAARCAALADLAEIWECGPAQVDFAILLQRLAASGYQRLVLLGGGRLNASWLAAAPVHRLELTVAPLLLGGEGAPTLVDGSPLQPERQLGLRHVEEEAGLLFLSYDVLP